MYRAALDTSVLVPSLTRDLLLQLATERCYQAVWGRAVVVELDCTHEQLLRLGGSYARLWTTWEGARAAPLPGTAEHRSQPG